MVMMAADVMPVSEDVIEDVHALQLEMAQAAYMDEAAPFRYDAARAARLIGVLERLVIALSEWRPSKSKR